MLISYHIHTQTEPELFNILEPSTDPSLIDEGFDDLEENVNDKATQTVNFECGSNENLGVPEKCNTDSLLNSVSSHENGTNSPDSFEKKIHEKIVIYKALKVDSDESCMIIDRLKDKDFDEVQEKAAETKGIKTAKEIGKIVAKTAVISGVAIGGVAAVLPLLGFTSAGVAAGSLAAAYQSTLGGYVASGSLFALCQSVGAAGMAASTQAAIVAGSGALASAHTAVAKLLKRKKQK